ncbi:uncharacterized protein EV420DRAFT_1753097 [Desarmillaria tabescens]|uniref:Uncharacterized protein n=1 Tax=Armillaria tabescens TaxID=1929756 RepID=A0AA39MM16_ARMTA|nr:uncharacterized protein EV420DRAFT_1753097 [Desarmillaria tabescens]KAK0438873.1 hypothetical protein EV420DRAFT_1753097 [Desarmillaria tabescens]
MNTSLSSHPRPVLRLYDAEFSASLPPSTLTIAFVSPSYPSTGIEGGLLHRTAGMSDVVVGPTLPIRRQKSKHLAGRRSVGGSTDKSLQNKKPVVERRSDRLWFVFGLAVQREDGELDGWWDRLGKYISAVQIKRTEEARDEKEMRKDISRSVGDGSINRLGNVPKETASQRDTLAAVLVASRRRRRRGMKKKREKISLVVLVTPTSSDASMETANERVFLEAVGIRLLNGLFLDDMSRLPRGTPAYRMPNSVNLLLKIDSLTRRLCEPSPSIVQVERLPPLEVQIKDSRAKESNKTLTGDERLFACASSIEQRQGDKECWWSIEVLCTQVDAYPRMMVVDEKEF